MLYVGYGSDTDCDGTVYYMVLFRATDIDDAVRPFCVPERRS